MGMRTLTALLAALFLTLGLTMPANATTQPTGTVTRLEYSHAQIGTHLSALEAQWHATGLANGRHANKQGTTIERIYVSRHLHDKVHPTGLVLATFFRPAGRIAFLLVSKAWCNSAFYCTA